MSGKPKRRTMWPWLIASLGASACAPVSTGGRDFCDVYTSAVTFPREVAQMVVADARTEAVKIDARNRYWDANCR
jgi:hypothetical protein